MLQSVTGNHNVTVVPSLPKYGSGTTSGILDEANARIVDLSDRIYKATADIDAQFDRLLGPTPEAKAGGLDQPEAPGSANDLLYRLQNLARTVDIFIGVASRVTVL